MQAAGPGELRQQAAALVADMSTAEQASSIVMGHIGGTDPAALRAYMQSGLGGFIVAEMAGDGAVSAPPPVPAHAPAESSAAASENVRVGDRTVKLRPKVRSAGGRSDE